MAKNDKNTAKNMFYGTVGRDGLLRPISFDSKEQRRVPTHDSLDGIMSSTKRNFRFHSKATTTTREKGYNLQHETSLFSKTGEVTANTAKAIMRDSLTAYYTIGIVRNITDMMAEIAVKGLRIMHPNRSVQDFWNRWGAEARLIQRSERFVNTLLRMGNVVVLNLRADLVLKKRTANIPYKFVLLNPLALDLERNTDLDDPELVLNITSNARKVLSKRGDKEIQKLLGENLIKKYDKNNGKVFLNMDRVFIGHYKKDDWQDWAFSLIFAALDDIEYKRKLRDMDQAAADGVINAVRIWKLGDHSLTPPIIPGPAAFSKLANVLASNPGGGVLDVIWDSLIDYKTDYPPVGEILGAEKYVAVNSDILADFGMAALLGTEGGPSNFAGQVMSVKPLIERLVYIREVLLDWLNAVINDVSKELNFRQKPIVHFDLPSFTDEIGRLKIAMQMWDRGLLSNEGVLRMVDQSWFMEKSRLVDEEHDREEDPKALLRLGPFMNPQVIEMLMQHTDPNYQPENPGDTKKDQETKKPGRPDNDPDPSDQDTKRETKPQGASQSKLALVREFYNLVQYQDVAKRLLSDTESIVTDRYLKEVGAKYVKSLTGEQTAELDDRIFKVFANTLPDTVVDDGFVESILRTEAPEKLDRCVRKVYKQLVDKFRSKKGREPNKDERRDLMSSSWAICRKQLGL